MSNKDKEEFIIEDSNGKTRARFFKPYTDKDTKESADALLEVIGGTIKLPVGLKLEVISPECPHRNKKANYVIKMGVREDFWVCIDCKQEVEK